ncbi:MAG: Mu-like prophage major head subunit gpT family protein [Actinomycetota bacterium]
MAKLETLRDIREAVGSDDFANLLGSNMHKRLQKAYAGVPGEYAKYCDIIEVNDFKNQNIITLTEAGDLDKLLEGEEYREAKFDESASAYRVCKYGKQLTVPWEMVRNDDLAGVNRMVDSIGRAARRTVAKFATALLVGTTASSTVTSALAKASLEAAITEFITRVDATTGEPLGIEPKFLIVPPALKWTAMELINSTLIVVRGDTDAVFGNKNTLENALDPIIEPFLADTNDWYLAADPAVLPGIELAFLRGYRDTPAMLRKKTDSSEELDFDTDSYVYKVRHVFGGARINANALLKVSVT